MQQAWGLLMEGRLEEVSERLERSQPDLGQNPSSEPAGVESLIKALARAYCLRGGRAMGSDDYETAVRDYETAIRMRSDCARAHASLARLLGSCHQVELRDGLRSIEHAAEACKLAEWKNASFISILAAAHAEAGDFSMAVERQNQAIALLEADEQETSLPAHEARLRLYEAGKPYHWSLIAWWTFEEMNREVVMDSSGNELNGQLVGDAHVVFDSERGGKVLCLDGDGDWLDCGNGTIVNAATEITIACWIKPMESGRYSQSIISKGDDAWTIGRFLDSGRLMIRCPSLAVSGSMDGVVTGQMNVHDNRWHHVAGVYNGTAFYLYIDGALDGSAEVSGRSRSSPWNLLIGQNDFERTRYGRDRSFKGLVDDVRIYDYALTETQIIALERGEKDSNTEGDGGR